jgi:pimeloyl-ACP methyl ester carboxylesterase
MHYPFRLFIRQKNLLCVVSALLLAVSALAQFGRAEFSDEGDFSEGAILSGVSATAAQCQAAANTVWVDTTNAGSACVKHWKAGFDALPVKRAVVFFHGEVFVGVGKTSKSYLDMNNDTLQKNANAWAKRLNMPYIFFARPGTYGSSGNHMQRRRIDESELISAALDEMKKRYGVEEWVVAGQSGGGHVASSLITQRADIVCAVPTSAPSSPRIRWEILGRSRDTTNYVDSYEPSKFVVKDKTHPQLRVFVLGDPNDRNVFWASQTVMADALQNAQIPVQLLQGQGDGPDSHGLSNSSRMVAGWCAKNVETDEMLKRAAKGLKG